MPPVRFTLPPAATAVLPKPWSPKRLSAFLFGEWLQFGPNLKSVVWDSLHLAPAFCMVLRRAFFFYTLLYTGRPLLFCHLGSVSFAPKSTRLHIWELPCRRGSQSCRQNLPPSPQRLPVSLCPVPQAPGNGGEAVPMVSLKDISQPQSFCHKETSLENSMKEIQEEHSLLSLHTSYSVRIPSPTALGFGLLSKALHRRAARSSRLAPASRLLLLPGLRGFADTPPAHAMPTQSTRFQAPTFALSLLCPFICSAQALGSSWDP